MVELKRIKAAKSSAGTVSREGEGVAWVRRKNRGKWAYRSVGKERRGGSTGHTLSGFDNGCESFSFGVRELGCFWACWAAWAGFVLFHFFLFCNFFLFLF